MSRCSSAASDWIMAQPAPPNPAPKADEAAAPAKLEKDLGPGVGLTVYNGNFAVVKERRELDAHEQAELDRAMDRAWAALPQHYEWLKNWEWV